MAGENIFGFDSWAMTGKMVLVLLGLFFLGALFWGFFDILGVGPIITRTAGCITTKISSHGSGIAGMIVKRVSQVAILSAFAYIGLRALAGIQCEVTANGEPFRTYKIEYVPWSNYSAKAEEPEAAAVEPAEEATSSPAAVEAHSLEAQPDAMRAAINACLSEQQIDGY